MTNGAHGSFYRIQDFVFRPDKLVHIDQRVGEGQNAGQHGLVLWFAYDLSPDRRINNGNLSKATVMWFDSVEDCEEIFRQLSGVHQGARLGG